MTTPKIDSKVRRAYRAAVAAGAVAAPAPPENPLRLKRIFIEVHNACLAIGHAWRQEQLKQGTAELDKK